jgi:hypothetical protein
MHNKFMTKCCSYYGVNESVHFNNVWEMSVQISLEANDRSTVLGLSTTNNYKGGGQCIKYIFDLLHTSSDS